jgi:hypothetical protein
MAGRVERLLGLLKTHWLLGRTTRPALFGLVACALKMCLCLIKAFLSLAECLVGGPLLGAHRGTDGLTEFVLDMEQVR